MRDQLDALQVLSEVDIQLSKLDEQIEQIPAQVRELDAEVQVLRNLLEKERQQMVEAEEWDQQLAKEISIQEELLVKSRAKQAGARNERELNAAQREIESVKKAMGDKEEERLQLMEVVSTRRESIGTHEAEIAELQKVLDAAEVEAKKKASKIESQKTKWHNEREAAASKVAPRVLKLYDNVRRGRTDAVVEIMGETCQGCNMQLPPQLYIEVQRMTRIHQCPYCRRIMYFKPPEEEQATE